MLKVMHYLSCDVHESVLRSVRDISCYLSRGEAQTMLVYDPGAEPGVTLAAAFLQDMRALGAKTYMLPARRGFKRFASALSLREMCRSYEVDALHTHSLREFWTAWLARALGARVTHVHSVHAPVPEGAGQALLHRVVSLLSDEVIAVDARVLASLAGGGAKAEAQAASDKGGKPPKVTLVPNGVEAPPQAEAPATEAQPEAPQAEAVKEAAPQAEAPSEPVAAQEEKPPEAPASTEAPAATEAQETPAAEAQTQAPAEGKKKRRRSRKKGKAGGDASAQAQDAKAQEAQEQKEGGAGESAPPVKPAFHIAMAADADGAAEAGVLGMFVELAARLEKDFDAARAETVSGLRFSIQGPADTPEEAREELLEDEKRRGFAQGLNIRFLERWEAPRYPEPPGLFLYYSGNRFCPYPALGAMARGIPVFTNDEGLADWLAKSQAAPGLERGVGGAVTGGAVTGAAANARSGGAAQSLAERVRGSAQKPANEGSEAADLAWFAAPVSFSHTEALAIKTLDLVYSAERYAQLAEASARFAAERHSLGDMGLETQNIYIRALRA